jgi:SH3-like domain-containing protein
MMSKKTFTIILFSALLMVYPVHAYAQQVKQSASVPDGFRSTSYPIPRFVTIGSGEVYARSGPGKLYPIKWIFKKKGLPVEIILEYETWRKVRDREGQVSWVYGSLLSGKRAGVVRGDEIVMIYKSPKKDGRIMAAAEPRALVDISECNGTWCKIKSAGYGGWMEQSALWGVYEDEVFD